jgi:hypothetical protein
MHRCSCRRIKTEDGTSTKKHPWSHIEILKVQARKIRMGEGWWAPNRPTAMEAEKPPVGTGVRYSVLVY